MSGIIKNEWKPVMKPKEKRKRTRWERIPKNISVTLPNLEFGNVTKILEWKPQY